MADNVGITPGAGASIASDDIAGVQFQRVKLALGADGAHDTDLDSGQQTMANSVPVAIASDQGAVKTSDAGPSVTPSRQYTASANMTTAADLTAAPTAGQKIVALDVLVSVDTAMKFELLEETSGTVLAAAYLPASGTVMLTFRSRLKLPTADKKLQGKASAAGNVLVTALYHSEA